MDLHHTPRRYITTDDTFTDQNTGTTYRAGFDDGAADPREFWDDSRVELYVYNSAIRTTNDLYEHPQHPAVIAFLHYYEYDLLPRGIDRNEYALAKTRRYMAAFHPEREGVIHLVPGHGYEQGSWHEAIIAIDADDLRLPTAETAEAYGNAYTQWRYGDVYWVENVDTGDALAGIYADSMEDAVRYFIATVSD